jgi:hypothetical protein
VTDGLLGKSILNVYAGREGLAGFIWWGGFYAKQNGNLNCHPGPGAGKHGGCPIGQRCGELGESGGV